MTTLPKGPAGRFPSTSISSDAAAIALMPKGQSWTAAHRSLPADESAMLLVPNGQTRFSDHLHPSSDGEANRLLPSGHNAGASPSPIPASAGANSRMPQGHTRTATRSPLQVEDGANPPMPKGHPALAPSSTIHTLRELHRQRQDFHRAEKSLTLQVKAICRRMCAGDKDEADKLYAAIAKGAADPQADMARVLVEPFFQARAIIEGNRKRTEKDMERAAKSLPVVEWVNGIKGLGIGSLAAIVGEAGDLASYPTHSHLWKRMGLAVIGGERQRRVAGADAIEHGYSPTRRSIMWNVGQCVFKAQSQRLDKETGEVKAEAGYYRKVYDARKEYELPRVESKGHAHNRAMRYMEKRLLRDLWKAWRPEATEQHG